MTMPPPRKSVFSEYTILLAEDDDDLRFVMECVLSEMGFAVIACANATQAQKAFRSHGSVAVLLTDYDMPGKTGVELAKDLTEARPALPVVILTGSILPAETLGEMEARGWTYLSKPCSFRVLEYALKNSVEVGRSGSLTAIPETLFSGFNATAVSSVSIKNKGRYDNGPI